MKELSKFDLRVLDVSRALFLEHGVMHTEMKDIAHKLGCSRSTLYRHFSSKSSILLVLATQSIQKFDDATRIPEGLRFVCGYDALEWQINSLIQEMILCRDDVTFLRDFDCIFTKDHPDGPEFNDYLAIAQGKVQKMAVWSSFARGMEDGSIRMLDTPELCLNTIVQGCFAFAQRIIPREHFYINAFGYGQELLRCYVKMMMESIKGK